MTVPWGGYPAGTLGQDLSSLNGIDEAQWRANMRADKLSGYDDAHDTWRGEFDSYDGQIAQLHDGQLALNDDVDGLEGARGYCCLYMSKNWNIIGNKWVTLPFDSQIGPNDDATPSGGNSIAMATKGLWRTDCHVTFYPPPGNWFSGAAFVSAQLSVVVMNGGTEFSRKTFDIVISSEGAETAAFSHTFVLPDTGYSIHAELYHKQSSAWIYGGTTRSALSVNKWSLGTDNAANLPTVPDGGTLS